MRPTVRNQYSAHMNYNDIANSATIAGYPHLRKRDWSSSVMMWLISMLFNVNGQKLFESSLGKKVSNPEWRQMIRDALSSYDDQCFLQKSVRGNCRSCYYFKKEAHQTIWRCFRCKSICQNCERDGSHCKFGSLVKTGVITVRNSYSNGKYKAKLIQRDKKGKSF